ncbi:MAG: hypothetical protein F6K42_10950 [Leptolyngbya sp. SIO1D8]|nr:hypothetical protein [Leptolyngbya sp. SIO1D8]
MAHSVTEKHLKMGARLRMFLSAEEDRTQGNKNNRMAYHGDPHQSHIRGHCCRIDDQQIV